MAIRGEIYFLIVYEFVSYFDEVQRGKYIYEEIVLWVFKGSVRKEVYDFRVYFL